MPKVVIKNDAYTPIRQAILEKYSLYQLADFGQFPGVASDAVGLFIEKVNKKAETDIYFFNENVLKEKNKVKQEIFSKNSTGIFSLSVNNKVQSILDKISENSKALSDIFQIRRGIELGQKSFIVKCQKCENYNEANTKYYGSFEKICKKCGSKLEINDKNILQISSDKESNNYKDKAISGTQLQRYSITNNYFIQSKLKGIDYKEDAFSIPKILVKRIATKIEGTFSDERLLAFNTVYSIFNKNIKKGEILFVLGVLNSKLMHFFYEYSYNVGMNLTTQVTIDFLSKIPIKSPSEKEQQKISEFVDKMLALQKKCRAGNIAGREKELLEQQIKQVDFEIDQGVYKIYGITEEEKRVIEGGLIL